MLPRKRLAPSAKGRKMTPKKTAFCELLPTKQRIVSSTQKMNRCHHEFFQNRILNFFPKGVIYPEKNLIRGTLPARELQTWSLGLQRIWALILIVEGPKMFVPQWLFSYDLPFSRYRRAKSPLISRTARNSATFQGLLQRQLVTDRIHIWQLGRCDRGVAPTVTSDDLGILLWQWHTLKGKFSKSRSRSRFLRDTSGARAPA